MLIVEVKFALEEELEKKDFSRYIIKEIDIK